MKHATLKELTASFSRLRAAADAQQGPPSALLKFYAAECGLKAAYMKHHTKGNTTESVGNAFGPNGHDLWAGLRALKVAASEISAPVRPKFQNDRPVDREQPVEIHELHEVWRYGMVLDEQGEASIIQWLATAVAVAVRQLDRRGR